MKKLFVMMLNSNSKSDVISKRFSSSVWRALLDDSEEKERKANEASGGRSEAGLFYSKLENQLVQEIDEIEDDQGRVTYHLSDERVDSMEPHDLIQSIIERHNPIKHRFCSASWKVFDKCESDILLLVIKHFTTKKIPILCIHDSVRIAAQHQDELVDVYRNAIKTILKKVEFADPSRLVDVDTKTVSYSGEYIRNILSHVSIEDVDDTTASLGRGVSD